MTESMLKSILVLTGVCLIAAVLLGSAYIATEDRISMQAEIALKQMLKEVMPDADNFIEEEEGLYRAMKEGNTLGFAALTENQGYSSVIKILIGMDMEENVKGVRIMEQAETPGLGANAAKPDFYNQFNNLKLKHIELAKEGGKIDAITGATITSEAIIEGVRKAIEEKISKFMEEEEIDAVTKATEIYAENMTGEIDILIAETNMSDTNA